MVAHYLVRKILVSLACTVSFVWFWIGRHSGTQHRYNDFSYPGHITPQIRHNDTNVGPTQGLTLKGNVTVLPDPIPSPYGYVFYATTAEYACSVIINIDRLNNIFHTKHRIIVLVKPTLGSEYLSNLTAQNATVIPYQPPPLYENKKSYYTDVLLKLVGFRLHQYIPSLERVLILDSDQVILQSLDHVFSLPAVDLAAPRAYWQGSHGFTSAFLLVNLSDRLWNRMEVALQNITDDTFDMDLLNQMFADTAMILPGDYCTLNSEWETNNIPRWWQGSEPPRDTSWQPSRKMRPRPDPRPIEIPPSLEIPLATNDTSNLTKADQILLSEYRDATANREKVIKAANDEVETTHKDQVSRDEMKERGKRLAMTLQHVYNDVKVMHYTALGKPWQKFVDDVKRERPDAHPLFAKGFELWRTRAAELCPPRAWKGEGYLL